jgi:hypothetical protein
VCSKFILEAGSHSYMEYASREKFLSRDKLSSPSNKQQSGFIMVSRWAVLEGVKWKLVCSKLILEPGSHFYMEYASRKIFLSWG